MFDSSRFCWWLFFAFYLTCISAPFTLSPPPHTYDVIVPPSYLSLFSLFATEFGLRQLPWSQAPFGRGRGKAKENRIGRAAESRFNGSREGSSVQETETLFPSLKTTILQTISSLQAHCPDDRILMIPCCRLEIFTIKISEGLLIFLISVSRFPPRDFRLAISASRFLTRDFHLANSASQILPRKFCLANSASKFQARDVYLKFVDPPYHGYQRVFLIFSHVTRSTFLSHFWLKTSCEKQG